MNTENTTEKKEREFLIQINGTIREDNEGNFMKLDIKLAGKHNDIMNGICHACHKNDTVKELMIEGVMKNFIIN